MKLWEVIKALTEDPTKKFEFVQQGWTERLTVDECGYLSYSQHAETRLEDDVDINNNNWKLVKQPVTWQEAIQAWADGKIIRLAMPGWENAWGPNNAVELNQCRIKDGTWYVED